MRGHSRHVRSRRPETGKRWLLTQINNWRLHSDIHGLDRVEGAKMSAGNRTRFMGRVFGSLLAWLLVSSSPAFACGEPGTAEVLVRYSAVLAVDAASASDLDADAPNSATIGPTQARHEDSTGCQGSCCSGPCGKSCSASQCGSAAVDASGSEHLALKRDQIVFPIGHRTGSGLRSEPQERPPRA